MKKVKIILMFIIIASATGFISNAYCQSDGMICKKNQDSHLETPARVSTENELSISNDYILQNFPNPFSLITVIEFKVAKTSNVSIEITNRNNEQLCTLVDGIVEKGNHKIFFKPLNEQEAGEYLCIMNVKSENNDVLFSLHRDLDYKPFESERITQSGGN